MIKIHVLKCGSTIVDEALPLSDRSKNPLAYTGIGRNRNHKIEVPVTEHLARLGYVSGNIDYCILTHLDIDHAGGLRLVKGAKQIMASEAEMAAAAKDTDCVAILATHDREVSSDTIVL